MKRKTRTATPVVGASVTRRAPTSVAIRLLSCCIAVSRRTASGVVARSDGRDAVGGRPLGQPRIRLCVLCSRCGLSLWSWHLKPHWVVGLEILWYSGLVARPNVQARLVELARFSGYLPLFSLFWEEPSDGIFPLPIDGTQFADKVTVIIPSSCFATSDVGRCFVGFEDM